MPRVSKKTTTRKKTRKKSTLGATTRLSRNKEQYVTYKGKKYQVFPYLKGSGKVILESENDTESLIVPMKEIGFDNFLPRPKSLVRPNKYSQAKECMSHFDVDLDYTYDSKTKKIAFQVDGRHSSEWLHIAKKNYTKAEADAFCEGIAVIWEFVR